MKLLYPAIFAPLEETDGFCVTFPNLPGCVTEGSTLTEALEMAADAGCGWILDELEDGKLPPRASERDAVAPEGSGAFVNLVILDIDRYAEKYGSKAIRKNCTIPAWLNTFGEQNNINFSQVLTDSLSAIYQQQQGQ